MARSLIPWTSPSSQMIGGLHKEFDSLFDRLFGNDRFFSNRLLDWPLTDGGDRWMLSTFPLNVAETDEHFEVTAELPGMKPDDFNVEIKGDELWISGEKKEEKEDKGKTYHRMERRYGSFRQTIPLGQHVDADKVEAEYKDGVLTVRVPKSEEAKPRRIAVK